MGLHPGSPPKIVITDFLLAGRTGFKLPCCTWASRPRPRSFSSLETRLAPAQGAPDVMSRMEAYDASARRLGLSEGQRRHPAGRRQRPTGASVVDASDQA